MAWTWIVREQDEPVREWWSLVPAVRVNRLTELEEAVWALGDQVVALAATHVLASTQVSLHAAAPRTTALGDVPSVQKP